MWPVSLIKTQLYLFIFRWAAYHGPEETITFNPVFPGYCSFGRDVTLLLLCPHLNKGIKLPWQAQDIMQHLQASIRSEFWSVSAEWQLMFPSVFILSPLCLAGRTSVLHQENNSIDTGQVDIGKKVGQSVPPGVFWRSQLNMKQPGFLKFNISVQKNALIGVYGRKGLAPSHTQVKDPFCVI